VPLKNKTIAFHDLIRGPIEFDVDQLDDFIIIRSDGSPTYNFVVAADDADMGITHIIRGEEHIANTPKQIVIYEALGLTVPEFAHLPLILSTTGKKLSKRDAAVAVIDYRSKGYLADALCNYLVRLGWAHGDQEIFSREELIKLFTLDGVGKKGAIFDQDKLDWINGLYIREKTAQDLLECIHNDVEPHWRSTFSLVSDDAFYKVIDAYKERVLTLRQLVDEVSLFFTGPTSYNQEDIEKYVDSHTPGYIDHIIQLLESEPEFSSSSIQSAIKNFAKAQGVSLAKLAQPIRIALLGKTSSPGVFALLSLLGGEEAFRRLSVFKDVLRGLLQKKE